MLALGRYLLLLKLEDKETTSEGGLILHDGPPTYEVISLGHEAKDGLSRLVSIGDTIILADEDLLIPLGSFVATITENVVCKVVQSHIPLL